jgi:hypothetical protein
MKISVMLISLVALTFSALASEPNAISDAFGESVPAASAEALPDVGAQTKKIEVGGSNKVVRSVGGEVEDSNAFPENVRKPANDSSNSASDED